QINVKLVIQIIVIFAIVSVLSMLTANINHYAHIGGLIVGALIGLIVNFKKATWKVSLISLIILVLFTLFSHYAMSKQSSIHPMDDEALYYYQEGDYDKALETVNYSFNREVETPMTYYILGELYKEAGQEEKGQGYIDKSYEMDPSNELAAKDNINEYRKEQDNKDIKKKKKKNENRKTKNYEDMNKEIDQLDKPIEDESLKILEKEVK